MTHKLLPYLNCTQLLVAVSFVCFLMFCKRKTGIQRLLFGLLALTFVMELANCLLMVLKLPQIIVSINYSMFALFFNAIWLLLLNKQVGKRYRIPIIVLVYLIFGFLNLFFYEGLSHFNHYNFIVGAFIYVFIFIYESFNQIKNEQLTFFQTNTYLLLFSPVILMLGYSILISFNSRTLNSTLIFDGITLYDFIGCFINFIYYFLIITYCYREKNITYA